MEKEETIIEETFQESDDGIVWRTIRKTTIITPEGQTEKFEVLGGIPRFVWRLSVFYCRLFLRTLMVETASVSSLQAFANFICQFNLCYKLFQV